MPAFICQRWITLVQALITKLTTQRSRKIVCTVPCTESFQWCGQNIYCKIFRFLNNRVVAVVSLPLHRLLGNFKLKLNYFKFRISFQRNRLENFHASQTKTITKLWTVKFHFVAWRNWVFATNSNFLFPISLQSNGEDLIYFKQ